MGMVCRDVHSISKGLGLHSLPWWEQGRCKGLRHVRIPNRQFWTSIMLLHLTSVQDLILHSSHPIYLQRHTSIPHLNLFRSNDRNGKHRQPRNIHPGILPADSEQLSGQTHTAAVVGCSSRRWLYRRRKK